MSPDMAQDGEKRKYLLENGVDVIFTVKQKLRDLLQRWWRKLLEKSSQ